MSIMLSRRGLIRGAAAGLVLPPAFVARRAQAQAGRMRLRRYSSPNSDLNAARAEYISSGFADEWGGLLANNTWDTDVTVTTSAQLQTALTNAISTLAKLGQRHRITCDWNGYDTSGAALIFAPGATVGANSGGYLGNAGGVLVRGAPGKFPILGDSVTVNSVAGVQFSNIGFGRYWSGAGSQETQNGLLVIRAGARFAPNWVRLDDCKVGAAACGAPGGTASFITGIRVNEYTEFLHLVNTQVAGCENGLNVRTRRLKIDGGDFQLCKQDFVNTAGFVTAGIYAFIWVKDTTFRNPMDGVNNRSNHMDFVQTGAAGDAHLGYRHLWENVVGHANHSFAGDPGLGGGTQGCYNDDFFGADNQYLIVNCLLATSSPNVIAPFSPAASRMSFIDRCTTVRAGMVPSGLPGDVNAAQDFSAGITGYDPRGNTVAPLWLKITNCIRGQTPKDFNASWAQETGGVFYDPRASGAGGTSRPEDIFVGGGVGFLRGEYTANKSSYHIPGEDGGITGILSTRTPAQFRADMWAMFEPKPAYAGKGAPDPR